MDRLPDLIQNSKLAAISSNGCTVHFYSHDSVARSTEREEHWRQESLIGGGGFGSVWKEKCIRGKQNVEVRAVKRIQVPEGWTKNKTYLRELELVAQFSNAKYERCFVKSYGWYELGGALNIAMEYLELGDLQSYLNNTTVRMLEAEVQQISQQLLVGIKNMHENRVAHRDLKPANILIKSQPPGPWWVKIADFGISKRMETKLGQPSTIKGTPIFMPPERLGLLPESDSSGPYPADIWSLGIIIFQMLTARLPFQTLADVVAYVSQSQQFLLDVLVNSSVSVVGCSFVGSTMLPSPTQRLSATQALKHEWIIHAAPSQTAREVTRTNRSQLKSDELPRGVTLFRSELSAPPSSYGGRVRIQAVSPNGTLSATGHNVFPSMHEDKTSTMIKIWTTATGKELPLFKEHGGIIRCVVFSPDGKMIASGGSEEDKFYHFGRPRSKVRLWDVDTGRKVLSFKTYDGDIRSVAFSPDSRMVATGGMHGTIIHSRSVLKLWDSIQGRELRSLQQHDGGIEIVAFSPGGTVLASGGCSKYYGKVQNSIVKLWNTHTGQELRSLREHQGWTWAIAFSPDGRVLASGGPISDEEGEDVGSFLKLWDASTGEQLQSSEEKGFTLRGLAFSQDGKIVASCLNHSSKRSILKLWNVGTGMEVRSIEVPECELHSANFLSDGKLAASGVSARSGWGTLNAAVWLWDVRSDG